MSQEILFMVVLGVDTGGTFTDFTLFDGEKVQCYKTLSTPKDPSIAVINGLKEIVTGSDEKVLIHGSTVATNALLEGKTAKTALITTQGFEDILEIGRGNRLDLYNIFVDSKPVLIPTDLRFPISERINKDGEIVKPLRDEDIQELINEIKRDKSIESIAVCFLFSYKNPGHEEKIGKRLQELAFPTSLSSEIVPEYREYERMTTTVVNALVSPIMTHYLTSL
ncbi:MAG TPA: hydantoinase/oxoprolinase family protein, partial [Spirochaetes bacterium]|nr:hydantoinase/oxoprolinase family protein [Spirochaetota bacterium]